MEQRSTFKAAAAAVFVAIVLLRGCVLPEVEPSGKREGTGSLPVDMGSVETQHDAHDAAPAEQPSAMDAGRETPEREADAAQAHDASVSAVDAAQPAQDAAPAAAEPPAADSGTRQSEPAACTCTTKDECCDGCRPLNEGKACKPDGFGCTLEICRAGVCVHEDRKDACWADGLCHDDGEPHFTNPCLVCDASRNIKGWSPRPMGSQCSDRVCNGNDFCGGGGNAGICISTRGACDEQTEVCDHGTALCKPK